MGMVTISVEESDVDWIEERVIELLARQIAQRAGKTLVEEAQAIAKSKVEQNVGTAVEEMTKKILDEGWEEMSSWGEPTGKRWTLRAHIVALLNREEGQYSDRGKMIDRTLRKAIDEKLGAELSDVFKEARLKFQTAVDAVVTQKLTETLKGALGLR